MSSIKIVLKREKAKGFTKIPLYLRITKNRKSSYKALGHKVTEKQWDANMQRVKSSHPNSARLNSVLANKVAEAEKQLLKDEEAVQFNTAKDLIKGMNKKGMDSFTQFGEEYLQRLLDEQNYSRHKKLKGILSKLSDYTNSSEISFNEINVPFLESYEKWMRNVRNNKTNTIHANMKFIRQLFREAVNSKTINPEQNPFLQYKLKQEKTQREYLTDEEIDRIHALELSGTKKICQDMFVFACDTGIRISDLLTIRRKNYDGKHLTFQMRKTKSTVSIMLSSRAQEILSTYEPNKKPKSEYLFPPMRGKSADKLTIEKAIMSKTAQFNSYLKSIAELAEIEKHVTFHVSRHSFGTRALRKGIRIEQASKLMGHSDLKTTMVYTKIVNSDLDEAMKAFD